MVRIGINDLNPERVLKNCKHLFLSLVNQSLLADRLGLPTMGEKVVHCTLHKYSLRDRGLDEAYEAFKGNYCDKCPDASPRPNEWKYSDKWQEAENKRQEQYMEEFWAKRSVEGQSP